MGQNHQTRNRGPSVCETDAGKGKKFMKGNQYLTDGTTQKATIYKTKQNKTSN